MGNYFPHHAGTEFNSHRHSGKLSHSKKLLGISWNRPSLFELGSEGEAGKNNKKRIASHFRSGLWDGAAEIPVREQGEEIP